MRIALAASALLALLSVTPAASALEWLDAPRDRVFAGPADDAARAFLHEQPSLGSVELSTRARLPSVVGTTVRFDQTWQGLPVFGASAAVRMSDDGHVTVATSTLVGRIGLATATPAMSSADALALAASLTRQTTAAVRAPVLGVLASGAAPQGGWLVWQVDVATGRGGTRLVLDAATGDVRVRQPLGRDAKGKVYPVDFAATPSPATVDLLDLDPLNATQLRGYQGQLAVYQYTGGDYYQTEYSGTPVVASNSDGDFLYDPPTTPTNDTDPFAAVNSYYHIHRIRNFYTSTLGVDMSAPTWQLGVVANALDGGSPLDNAFFSPLGMGSPPTPNLIAIGQGSQLDFAYDSDIFIHEFTHYAAHNAINYNDGQFEFDAYGITAFGGSIDEGTADYFACTVNNDPLLGGATLAEYTRDLSAPSATCPEGLTGETHEDGKIIGTASWAIRQLIGPALADPMIWSGMTLLHKGSSLQDFATGVLKTADAMVAAGKVTADQRAQIEAVFASRGLDDCGRVLSLNKSPRTVMMYGLGTLGQYYGTYYSCDDLAGIPLESSFHFSFKPDAGDNRLRFTATVEDLEGYGGLSWTIQVRRGEHVAFTATQDNFPEVTAADHVSSTFFSSSGELVLGEGTPYPIDPGQTYYAVVVHQNCPYTRLSISASSDHVTPPPVGGAGGVSGSAGTGGVGGSAGQAGGSAGVGGMSGTSGHSGVSGASGQGGLGGQPPSGGHAGTTSTGGTGATGGSAFKPAPGQPALEAVPSITTDDGCSTSSTGASASSSASAAWVLGLLVATRRRRR